jgi:hypothetical protein
MVVACVDLVRIRVARRRLGGGFSVSLAGRTRAVCRTACGAAQRAPARPTTAAIPSATLEAMAAFITFCASGVGLIAALIVIIVVNGDGEAIAAGAALGLGTVCLTSLIVLWVEAEHLS